MLSNTGDGKLYQTALKHKTIDLVGCLKGKNCPSYVSEKCAEQIVVHPLNFEINYLIK
jgi:hypothetical protein